jgi:hypothetical protein
VNCAEAHGPLEEADDFEYAERGLYDINYRWEGYASDGDKWVKYVSDAIDEHGLMNAKQPSDAAEFCPNFKSLSLEQKKMFWIYLVSATAELESSFNPKSSYTEDFKDSSGTKVVSRGLLQLSLESAQDYGCPVSKGADLYDPKTNLDCGIRILEHWIQHDGRIAGKSGSQWLGAGRYWAPFRHKPTKIKGWTKSIPFC